MVKGKAAPAGQKTLHSFFGGGSGSKPAAKKAEQKAKPPAKKAKKVEVVDPDEDEDPAIANIALASQFIDVTRDSLRTVVITPLEIPLTECKLDLSRCAQLEELHMDFRRRYFDTDKELRTETPGYVVAVLREFFAASRPRPVLRLIVDWPDKMRWKARAPRAVDLAVKPFLDRGLIEIQQYKDGKRLS